MMGSFFGKEGSCGVEAREMTRASAGVDAAASRAMASWYLDVLNSSWSFSSRACDSSVFR